MKAITYQTGKPPQLSEIPEPAVAKGDELLLSVKAVAVKNLDKAKVSGKHYSSHKDSQQAVVGSDGMGILADGTRVYAVGQHGMMAEKAIVEKDRVVRVPDNVSDVVAAALPNAVMGSALAMQFRAGMEPGNTVLVNGATGFTGKIAVQLAKHYGAKKIIATGRNEEALQSLLQLGADEVIQLQQDDEEILQRLKHIHAHTPIDVILDYLWGHSAEMILSVLKGKGTFSHRTRYVTIGAMSGDIIRLSSQILRSVDLHLTGSGIGSWTKREVQQLFSEILPATFQLAGSGKLIVDTAVIGMNEVEKLWDAETPNGKRMVVIIS